MNVFDQAVEVLNRRGWHQGGFVSDSGVCALAALNLAEGLDMITGTAKSALLLTDIVMERFPERVSPMRHEMYTALGSDAMWLDMVVADFNDHPKTTEEQVRTMLGMASDMANDLDEFQLDEPVAA